MNCFDYEIVTGKLVQEFTLLPHRLLCVLVDSRSIRRPLLGLLSPTCAHRKPSFKRAPRHEKRCPLASIPKRVWTRYLAVKSYKVGRCGLWMHVLLFTGLSFLVASSCSNSSDSPCWERVSQVTWGNCIVHGSG